MTAPILEVSDLGKRYIIQHEAQHQSTLRDTLQQGARQLWRRLRGGGRFEKEEFWALRDINFTIQPGEVVGIIGRNGAGKSTLLKCLSRITEPTCGRITLRGRVASLLEVGTGFHPELSGRENIYLNGSILGMTRAEIRKKFDEIVAFAEVEKFLDTPVKRYSSGMYVRLAFAVAAHLEPEILIVDEVLAVGDQKFQNRCLGKMRDIARCEQRTILFVSHNLGAVSQLCTKSLLIHQGEMTYIGNTHRVIQAYTELAQSTEQKIVGNNIAITNMSIDGDALAKGDIIISINFSSKKKLTRPYASITITNESGQAIVGSDTYINPIKNPKPTEEGKLRVHFAKPPLAEGNYRVNLNLGESDANVESFPCALDFHYSGRRVRPNYFTTEFMGPVDFDAGWEQMSL